MKSVGVRTVETIMLVLVMLIAVFASCHKSATSSSSSSASKSISPFITIDGVRLNLKISGSLWCPVPRNGSFHMHLSDSKAMPDHV
jgi:hypothetical protein